MRVLAPLIQMQASAALIDGRPTGNNCSKRRQLPKAQCRVGARYHSQCGLSTYLPARPQPWRKYHSSSGGGGAAEGGGLWARRLAWPDWRPLGAPSAKLARSRLSSRPCAPPAGSSPPPPPPLRAPFAPPPGCASWPLPPAGASEPLAVAHSCRSMWAPRSALAFGWSALALLLSLSFAAWLEG